MKWKNVVWIFSRKWKIKGKKLYTYFPTNAKDKIWIVFLIILSNSVVKLNLEKIELIYLCPRYSQNKNDNSYSVIENISKSKFIHTATQWEIRITQAFRKNSCEVKVVTHGNFIDFKSIHKLPEYSEVFQENVKWLSLERKRKWCGYQLNTVTTFRTHLF